MKKVYLFTIMCLLGMMVSQRVLAESTEDSNVTFEVSDGGKTITITSHKAGALSGGSQYPRGSEYPAGFCAT